MSAISSSEVRRRAIEAYRSGQGSQEQIARMFRIARRTLQIWLRDYRQEQRLEPRPRGHNPARFRGALLEDLDAYVDRRSDVTLAELQEVFADRVACSDVTIHNTLKRLGWRFKKSGYVRVSKTDPT